MDEREITYSGEIVSVTSSTYGDPIKPTTITLDNWGWDYYRPIYVPYVQTVYNDYYEKAFGVMKMFLKNGYFKKITVKKHNEMIEEIAKELRGF